MDDQERPVSPVVMTMPEEIDVSNAGYVGEQLRSLIAPGVSTVVADLTATTFCDSFAVLHLMLAHDKAAANHAELLLVVPPGAVLRLLDLMGARRVLRIYPTVADALAAVTEDCGPGDQGTADDAAARLRGTSPRTTTAPPA